MNSFGNFASIADENGNLICYSNGLHVCTKNFHRTLGNDSLNTTLYDFEDYEETGDVTPQGLLILPNPNYNGKYHFFYCTIKYTGFPPALGGTYYGVIGLNLYEALFDNSLNNGQGDFIYKDRPVIQDTMGNGQIQACRHANGRDWWIVQRRYDTGSFYVYLFDVTGIHVHSLQHISNHIGMGVGQACFSPDGSKYVTVEAGCHPPCTTAPTYKKVAIYDFDRCTGTLSNEKLDDFIANTNVVACAISPNSRYLYVFTITELYQYDLQANDVINSRILVHDFIGGGTWLRLAPDNRIYIEGLDSYKIIENPDERGIACNAIENAIILPFDCSFFNANFPNFRLGPIDGSACDTLGINDVTAVEPPKFMFQPINIYPNPANYSITITINYALYLQNQIHVYNAQGALMEAIKTQTPKTTLHIAHYASGLYFIKVINPKGEVIAENKFVKQ